MKKILFSLGCIFHLAGYAQVVSLSLETVNTNIGLIVELNGSVDLTGYATYRLYALCATEDTKVITAYGRTEEPAGIMTTTSFWNAPSALHATGDRISDVAIVTHPSLVYDSWVTISCESFEDCGSIPGTNIFAFDISTQSTPNRLINSFVGAGSSCVMNSTLGCLWGTTKYFAQPAGPDLKILLGQFTTTGEVFGQLNLQYVTDNTTCDSPITSGTFSFGNYPIGCADPLACNYDPAYDANLPQVCIPAGCTDPTQCNYDPNAGCDDGSCISPAFTCEDPTACNYQLGPFCDALQCTYPGCTNSNACNYDANAGCDDGSCSGISGCTFAGACNYNDIATCDNGSCISPGCDDPLACNYDPTTCGGGPCIGTPGCMVIAATNYNPSATCDDSSCLIVGCTDSNACNYYPLATSNDGSCFGHKGCMNAQACNYDPTATCSGSYCELPGCNNPLACNYDPYTCGSGYCSNGSSAILLFNDLNGNGQLNSLEGSISGFIQLHFEPGNYSISSNNQSYISLSTLPTGTYTVTVVSYQNGWVITSIPGTVTTNSCQYYYLGIDNAVNAPCSHNTWIGSIHCSSNVYGGIYYANYGAESLHLTVTAHYNPALHLPSSYPAAIELNDSTLQWDIDNYSVDQFTPFSFALLPPNANYLGQTFQFDVEITATNANGDVVCDISETIFRQFSCGLDPNEKSAQPIGYTENHFVLSGQEMLYTIQFQNTGNDFAHDVDILDEIDPGVFDLNSLQVVYASHPMIESHDGNGTTHFYFQNIMLPDSGFDEVGSHGFVMYRIALLPKLPFMTQVENTASIYFDFNDPVITNATQHSIFDCDQLSIPGNTQGYCVGDSTSFFAEIPYAETLTWQLQNETIGYGQTLNFNLTESALYTLDLIAENPLCSRTSVFTAEVYPLPQANIVATTNGQMYGPSIYTYEWYANDELILGENNDTLDIALVEGTLVYAIAIDEHGCSTTTNTLTVTQTVELSNSSFSLFPNPMHEFAVLKLPTGNWDIRIINSSGQLVLSKKTNSTTFNIDKSYLTNGIYSVVISGNNANTVLKLVVD